MTEPQRNYRTPPLNFNGAIPPINFRFKRSDVVIGSGANHNIARSDANYLRLTGPSGAFSISGFDTPLSGMVLYVHVANTQILTITNRAGSATANQIDTGTGADVVVSSTPCVLTFIYDLSVRKWTLTGVQAKGGSSNQFDDEVYYKDGTLSVGAGTLRYYNFSPVTYTIPIVYVHCNTAPVNSPPTGAALIIDVNKNGVSMFTTAARPSITSGQFTGSGVPDVSNTLDPGDYLQVDIDRVGDSVAGANMGVQFTIIR